MDRWTKWTSLSVGTPQQLKARHGTAYTLRVQLNPFAASSSSAAVSDSTGGGGGGGGGDGGGGSAAVAAVAAVAASAAASASREDVEALHALVASAAPSASSSSSGSGSSSGTFDGARGCSYELNSLDLPSLARLCATLEAAQARPPVYSHHINESLHP